MKAIKTYVCTLYTINPITIEVPTTKVVIRGGGRDTSPTIFPRGTSYQLPHVLSEKKGGHQEQLTNNLLVLLTSGNLAMISSAEIFLSKVYVTFT